MAGVATAVATAFGFLISRMDITGGDDDRYFNADGWFVNKSEELRIASEVRNDN